MGNSKCPGCGKPVGHAPKMCNQGDCPPGGWAAKCAALEAENARLRTLAEPNPRVGDFGAWWTVNRMTGGPLADADVLRVAQAAYRFGRSAGDAYRDQLEAEVSRLRARVERFDTALREIIEGAHVTRLPNDSSYRLGQIEALEWAERIAAEALARAEEDSRG